MEYLDDVNMLAEILRKREILTEVNILKERIQKDFVNNDPIWNELLSIGKKLGDFTMIPLEYSSLFEYKIGNKYLTKEFFSLLGSQKIYALNLKEDESNKGRSFLFRADDDVDKFMNYDILGFTPCYLFFSDALNYLFLLLDDIEIFISKRETIEKLFGDLKEKKDLVRTSYYGETEITWDSILNNFFKK